MPKHRADAGKADAVTKHLRRRRVAQNMGTLMSALDPGPDQRAPYDPFDGAASDGPDRRAIRDKHSRRLEARPAAFDIGDKRIADFLGQRQPFRTT